MMTSSVSLRTKSLLRKRAPSTGIFVNPGSPLTACLTSSRTRPAIIIEPPEGSSTVVSARRLRSDRAFMPGLRLPVLLDTDPSVVGSETEVLTFRLIRPGDNPTGWNSKPIPYSHLLTV